MYMLCRATIFPFGAAGSPSLYTTVNFLLVSEAVSFFISILHQHGVPGHLARRSHASRFPFLTCHRWAHVCHCRPARSATKGTMLGKRGALDPRTPLCVPLPPLHSAALLFA